MTQAAPSPRPSNSFRAGNLLVVALQGWNDAGDAASNAVWELQHQLGIEMPFERIDDEDYFDYTVVRPRLEFDAEGRRRVRWPAANLTGSTIGLYTLTGIEPNFHWRRFAAHIIDLAEALKVRGLVLVGSMLADTPHTRDTPVSKTSDDRGPQQEFDLEPPRYEGPTGILSALDERAHDAGMQVVNMWASVPHYAQTPDAPNPKATLALVGELAELLGVELRTDHLREQTRLWEQRVSEAVAADDELRAYVEYLERNRDMVDSEAATGEAIAAEFERFLARGAHGPSKGRSPFTPRATGDDPFGDSAPTESAFGETEDGQDADAAGSDGSANPAASDDSRSDSPSDSASPGGAADADDEHPDSDHRA